MSRDNRDRPNSNDNDDERNPFVAFRHFADEQLSTAARGFGDISSVFGEAIKTFEQVERDARLTWKKFEDHYERAMNPERKRLEGKDHVQAASSSCRNKELHSQQDSTDSWFTSPFCLRSRFGSSRWRDSRAPPESAVQELTDDMFFSHPYSPFRLEEASEMKGCSLNWRRAFEDLMRVQEGQALTDSTQYPKRRLAEDEFWAQHPLIRSAEFNQWKSSLRQRQLMKDGFFTVGDPWSRGELWQSSHATPYAIQHAIRFEKQYGGQQGGNSDNGSGPETELDMYEQFLGRQVRSSSSTPPEASSSGLELQPSSSSNASHALAPSSSSLSSSCNTTTEETPKPSIVATLTTTERHMQSDGTVTSKTVLKKRFSDGTEHSEESSNTTQVPIHELKWPDAGTRLLGSRRTATTSQQQQQQGVEEAPAKKASKSGGSWFWSS